MLKSTTPQSENGFTRIAGGGESNDVLMALVKQRLSATEYQIMLLVIRKTWGFNKKDDWISLTQFQKYLSKSRLSITESIKRLVQNNILVRQSTPGIKTIYRVNKNFKEWNQLVQKSVLGKFSNITSTENYNQLVQKSVPTKDTITKDTIQKTGKSFFSSLTEKETERIITELRVSKETVAEYSEQADAWSNGKGNKMLNWYLTIRNWIRRDIKSGKINQDLTQDEKLSIEAKKLGIDLSITKFHA